MQNTIRQNKREEKKEEDEVKFFGLFKVIRRHQPKVENQNHFPLLLCTSSTSSSSSSCFPTPNHNEYNKEEQRLEDHSADNIYNSDVVPERRRRRRQAALVPAGAGLPGRAQDGASHVLHLESGAGRQLPAGQITNLQTIHSSTTNPNLPHPQERRAQRPCHPGRERHLPILPRAHWQVLPLEPECETSVSSFIFHTDVEIEASSVCLFVCLTCSGPNDVLHARSSEADHPGEWRAEGHGDHSRSSFVSAAAALGHQGRLGGVPPVHWKCEPLLTFHSSLLGHH